MHCQVGSSAVSVQFQGSFRAVSGRVYCAISVQIQSSQSYSSVTFHVVYRAISVQCQVGSSAVSEQRLIGLSSAICSAVSVPFLVGYRAISVHYWGVCSTISVRCQVDNRAILVQF